MKKTLLITGASGFVGRVAMAHFADSEQYVPVALPALDLRDAAAVHAAVAGILPHAVLHLAAQSFVPRSFEAPQETFDINLLGTLNLLQALRAANFAGTFLYVSSGDIYGRVPEDELPVTEARFPEPRSPYAVSKFAAEQLCLQWHRTEGWDVKIARPFNHVGPGQDPLFVLPAFARQVIAIAQGRQSPVIDVGDIDTTRDFTDVRDVVAAYDAILARGRAGATYLIGSGTERRVRDLLSMMCTLEGITPEIRQDAARLRPAEQRRMVADASLLRRDTGWEPQHAIATTLNDILHAARTSA